MIFYSIYVILIFISNYQTIFAVLTCRDEAGNPTDFYLLYKPPNEEKYFFISRPSKPSPTRLFPTTGNIQTTDLEFSDKKISEKDSFVENTFREVYKDSKKFNYIMYNDKKPDGTESSSLNLNGKKILGGIRNYGKSKGVLAWSIDSVNPSNNRAILFQHSVPKWLPKFSDTNYYWPDSSTKLSPKKFLSKLSPKLSFLNDLKSAHMALCINVKFSDIKDLIKKLIITDVQVYSKFLQSGQNQLIEAQQDVFGSTNTAPQGKSRFNIFTSMFNRKKISDSDLYQELRTQDGLKFTIYTKPKTKIGDIFKIMAKKTGSNGYHILSRSFRPKISSFRNLSQRLKPKCTNDKFIKILGIKIKDKNWISKDDETNWAVKSESSNDFCFSDIGNSLVGFREAGSLICLNDAKLHRLFFSAIENKSCK